MSAWTQLTEPGPALLILVLATSLPIINAAPFEDSEQSSEIEYYPVADATGCYYNFEHYDEGDRIITNEPCLNCTCHNRMLMCYLRVCPFTKAIGQDCRVEKKPDQCCPVITCPEVPVHLLPQASTTPSTALGHLNDYGCSIDNLFYADGAKVPSNPNNPCEVCYCIRNKTACIIQECTLTGDVVEGCRPVYVDGICCPVRYDCDHPELETTSRPLLTTTTLPSTSAPTDCIYHNEVYADGALVKKDIPCEQCYCMKGDIVCAVQECGPTPLDKVNCTALPRKEGQCCPDTYECDHISEEDLTTLSYYDVPTTEPTELLTSKSSVSSTESEESTTVFAVEEISDRKVTESITEAVEEGAVTEAATAVTEGVSDKKVTESTPQAAEESAATEAVTESATIESFTSRITEAVDAITSRVTDIVEVITSAISGSDQEVTEQPQSQNEATEEPGVTQKSENVDQAVTGSESGERTEPGIPVTEKSSQETESPEKEGPESLVTELVTEQFELPAHDDHEEEMSHEDETEVEEGSGKPIEEQHIPSLDTTPEAEPDNKQEQIGSEEKIKPESTESGVTTEQTKELEEEGSGAPEEQSPQSATESETTAQAVEITGIDREDEKLYTTVSLESESHVKVTVPPQAVTEGTMEAAGERQGTTEESSLTDTEVHTTITPIEPEMSTEGYRPESSQSPEILSVTDAEAQETIQPLQPEISTEESKLEGSEAPEIQVVTELDQITQKPGEVSVEGTYTTEESKKILTTTTENIITPTIKEELQTEKEMHGTEEPEIETEQKGTSLPEEGVTDEIRSEHPQEELPTTEAAPEPQTEEGKISPADEQAETEIEQGTTSQPKDKIVDEIETELPQEDLPTTKIPPVEEPQTTIKSIEENEGSQPSEELTLGEVSTIQPEEHNTDEVKIESGEELSSTEVTFEETQTTVKSVEDKKILTTEETVTEIEEVATIAPEETVTEGLKAEEPEEKLTTTLKSDEGQKTSFVTQEPVEEGEEIRTEHSEESLGTTERSPLENVKQEDNELVPPVQESQTTTKSSQDEETVTEAEKGTKEELPVDADSGKPVTTTEEEGLQIITEIPSKETEVPESMDHISETAPQKPTPEKEIPVTESEQSISGATYQPESHTNIPESEATTNIPRAPETSENCGDKDCGSTQTTIEPTEIKVSCTKETCIPEELSPDSDTRKDVPDCESQEGCVQQPPQESDKGSISPEKEAPEVTVPSDESLEVSTTVAIIEESSTTEQPEEASRGTELESQPDKPEQTELIEGSGFTEQSTVPQEYETSSPEKDAGVKVDDQKQQIEKEYTESPLDVGTEKSTEKIFQATILPEFLEISTAKPREELIPSESPKIEATETTPESELSVSPIALQTTKAPEIITVSTETEKISSTESPEEPQEILTEGIAHETSTNEENTPEIALSESPETQTEGLQVVDSEGGQTTEGDTETHLEEGKLEPVEPVVTLNPQINEIVTTEGPASPTDSASVIPENTPSFEITITEQPAQEERRPEDQSTEEQGPKVVSETVIPEVIPETITTVQSTHQINEMPSEKYPVDVSQQSSEAEVPVTITESETEVTTEPEEYGIPGEGSCLVEGQTYKNNTFVPPINQCQTSCRCLSSILQCESVECSPPPSNLQCVPIVHSTDACCPIYSCSVPGVTSMESDSHVVETTTVDQREDQPITENIPIVRGEDSATSEAEKIPATADSETEGSTENIPRQPITETPATELPAKSTEVAGEITEIASPELTTQQEIVAVTETVVSVTESKPKESESPEGETGVSSGQTTSAVEDFTSTPSHKPSEEQIPTQDEIENEIPEEPLEPVEPVQPVVSTETTELPEQELITNLPGSSQSLEPETPEQPEATEKIQHEEQTERTEQEEDLLKTTVASITEAQPIDTVETTEDELIKEISTELPEISPSLEPVTSPHPEGTKEEELLKTTIASITEQSPAEISEQPEQVTTSDKEGSPEATEPAILGKPIEEEPSVTDKKEEEATEQITVHTSVTEVSEIEQSELTTVINSEESSKTPEEAAAEPEMEEPVTTPSITETIISEGSPKVSEQTTLRPEEEINITSERQPELVETEQPFVSETETELPAPQPHEHIPGPVDDEIKLETPEQSPLSTVVPVEQSETTRIPEIEIEIQTVTEPEHPITTSPLESEAHVTEIAEKEGEKPKDFTEGPITEISPEITSEEDNVIEGSGSYQTESVPEEPITEHVQVPERQPSQPIASPEEFTPVKPTTISTEATQRPTESTDLVTEAIVTEKQPAVPVTEGEKEVPVTEYEKDITPVDIGEFPTHALTENKTEIEYATPLTETSEVTTAVPVITDSESARPTEGEIFSKSTQRPEESTAPVTDAIVTEKQPAVPVTEGEKEVPVTEYEKEITPVDIGEFPTHALTENKTEIEYGTPLTETSQVTTGVPVITDSESARPTEGEIFSKSTQRPEESTAPVSEAIVTEKQPAIPVTESEKEVPATEYEKEITPVEIGEFPTHALTENKTEIEYATPLTETSEVTTGVPVITDSEPARSTEGEIFSKPTEKTVTVATEKEEPAYTSPQLTTQSTINASEPYTSGPPVELSTKKSVEGELSTSLPVAPISTSQPTTSVPYAPAPEHDIPGEHVPELPDYQSPIDEYEDEEQSPLGPGTCRYGGKVYVSAQQIPRDDPCDFCFCFRSDIICLQQSCPPPIPRCHEEPIRGFCCPRYECPVGMATSVNLTTSTTTTTTTLPPHFLSHVYRGRVTKSGCQIKGRAYKVGDVIPSASGPCLHCTCGGDGEMKCDPKACSPEPMLRQMIAAAASRRRR